eukprot:2633911-Pleurochrysis_carterae.AAC.1
MPSFSTRALLTYINARCARRCNCRHMQEAALFEEMEQVASAVQPDEVVFVMVRLRARTHDPPPPSPMPPM